MPKLKTMQPRRLKIVKGRATAARTARAVVKIAKVGKRYTQGSDKSV